MAVRHEVENLVRRGNIFYWRPRIPSCFLSCRSGSRLSLSLQLSDHKKAQVIARRLNLRLAELKQERREFMSTREQLQKLFSHIRDQFLDDLENISIMAKRHGRAGDVIEMELDLEAGWAYELLAKFGTRDLTLEGDCPGLAFLLTHDVPASHVAAIKSNFLGELKIARSAGFEERIRGLMSSFDIPDTVLNREKAMTQFFEARAAALLTIDERHALVDKSKSEFTRERRNEAVPVAPVEAAQPASSSATVVEQLPFTGGPVVVDGTTEA